MIAAIQRARTAFSPSTSEAPSMMKIGVVKPIATLSASGMCGRAENHSSMPAVWVRPRQTWTLKRLVA